jgi:sulfide dehydrogenase cytochrome subunit
MDAPNEDLMTHTRIFAMRLGTALAMTVGLAATAQAQNQNATQLHNRATAAMCANCHGTDGRTVEGSAIPSLVGMPKEYHVLQMKAFKDGTRPATVMHQITKGLTDAQIDTIATYYAALKR